MTLEERFEEWKSKQYKDQSTEEKMEFVEHLHYFPKYFKQAYLAGAKENGVVWHDLRKDPQDLPKEDVVLVQAKGGGHFIALYYPEDRCWGIYNMLAETLNREVIAWCEIPQFKE